jgi:alpha,alpha-trehalase
MTILDSKRFDAVLLDLDGVLTDTAGVHAKAWKRLFDAYLRDRAGAGGTAFRPFALPDDYLRYVDGKPRYDGVASFLAARGIQLPWGSPDDEPDRETVCGLGNRKNDLFAAVLDREGVQVFPGTVETLHRWRDAGYRLAVVSSSRNTRTVLDTSGLLEFFDAIVDGNDLLDGDLEGKPAPDTFLEAAHRLHVEPARAVVVEDALAGVEAGHAGGFGLVVGVARHDNAASLREHGATMVVREVAELEPSA